MYMGESVALYIWRYTCENHFSPFTVWIRPWDLAARALPAEPLRQRPPLCFDKVFHWPQQPGMASWPVCSTHQLSQLCLLHLVIASVQETLCLAALCPVCPEGLNSSPRACLSSLQSGVLPPPPNALPESCIYPHPCERTVEHPSGCKLRWKSDHLSLPTVSTVCLGGLLAPAALERVWLNAGPWYRRKGQLLAGLPRPYYYFVAVWYMDSWRELATNSSSRRILKSCAEILHLL